MKRPPRALSHRIAKIVSVTLCYSLIATTIVTHSNTARANGSYSAASDSDSAGAGLLTFPARVLGAFLTLVQGGGSPSVPGPNLPNLDVARQTQVNEPEALPPIPSELSCEDCVPCPDCLINHKSIARHGGPYFGSASQPIQFNGLGLFDPDPDDEVTDYIWTFGDFSSPLGRNSILIVVFLV